MSWSSDQVGADNKSYEAVLDAVKYNDGTFTIETRL